VTIYDAVVDAAVANAAVDVVVDDDAGIVTVLMKLLK
jgi:hypothetical protein